MKNSVISINTLIRSQDVYRVKQIFPARFLSQLRFLQYEVTKDNQQFFNPAQACQDNVLIPCPETLFAIICYKEKYTYDK